MPLNARIIIGVADFILLFFVLNGIRRRRIGIEYSILWLIVSLLIGVLIIFRGLGDRIAYFLGIEYPPALFFFVAIFFIILVLLHYSIELTKLKEYNKRLVQELSILKKFSVRR